MTTGDLSTIAEKKMWDLFKDHDHEAGIKYTGDKTGKKDTDCITYVRNVISHAYKENGKPDVADNVWKYTEGIPLAKFLIGKGWRAHYWNPDVRFPRDGDSEHPFSYQQAVKTSKYYNVKVDGFIVNYNLDFKKRPTGGFLSGCNSGPKPQNNNAIWNKVSNVRFGYGLARGGMHTFLYSFGMVYEVHWDQIGANLYGKESFYTYEWLSGLLLAPPSDPFRSDPA